MWAWVSLVRCIHWQLMTSQRAELAEKRVSDTSKPEAGLLQKQCLFSILNGNVWGGEGKMRLTKHWACLSGIGAILALGEMWVVVQKEHWYHYMSFKNVELLMGNCLVNPRRLLIHCSVQCADFGKKHSPSLPLFFSFSLLLFLFFLFFLFSLVELYVWCRNGIS